MGDIEHFAFGSSIAPYSDAVRTGPFFFLSGKIAIKDGKIVGNNITEQAELTMENLKHTVEKLGCKMSDIVKITAFLTDVNHFGDFNEEYKKAFSAPYPARTCVMVKELPMNALVEVEAIIYKKE